MAEFHAKNFHSPDQVIRLPKFTADIVEVGELTVGLLVTQPGWRWSVDFRPHVGGEWCQARHLGVVLSGRVGHAAAESMTFEAVDLAAGMIEHGGVKHNRSPYLPPKASGDERHRGSSLAMGPRHGTHRARPAALTGFAG